MLVPSTALPRVLVVDDDCDAREALVELLETPRLFG